MSVVNIPTSATGYHQSIVSQAASAQRVVNRMQMSPKLNPNGFVQPLGRITNSASEFQKSMDASAARVFAFGAAVGVINGISDAFASVVSSAVEVEKALKDVQVVMEATDQEMRNFGRGIFDVAKNTAQSFETVSQSAIELARQGLGAEETLARVNSALILSRLSGLSAVKSTETLTAAINSFNKEGITHEQIINRMANVDAAFAVSSADLAQAISRAGAVAQSSGVSFNELASIVTAVQQRTARGGSVIGNGFKSIFTRIKRSRVREALEEIGVATKNNDGSFRSSIAILKDYANVYKSLSDAQKSYTSEQIAGVFQIQNLQALIQDLNDDVSIYNKALGVANNTTNQATLRNQELNKTLSALFSQASSEVKEFAARLGELGLSDSFKNIVKAIGSLAGFLNDALDEEKGSTLAKSFVKGFGSFLTGPGLVVLGAAFLKIFKLVSGFAVSAFSDMMGINKEAKRQQGLQAAIGAALANNNGLYQKILAAGSNTAKQEQIILNIIRQETAERMKQEAVVKRLASSGTLYGIGAKESGYAPVGGKFSKSRSMGKKALGLSGGFLPSLYREQRDINSGVGGARKGDRPVVLKNHKMGGGKTQSVVAHTGEWRVPNFAGSGGDAIFNRSMVKSFGLPKGAKRITASSGLVPNFSKGSGRVSATSLELGFKEGGNSLISKKSDYFDSFSSSINLIRNEKSSKQLGGIAKGDYNKILNPVFFDDQNNIIKNPTNEQKKNLSRRYKLNKGEYKKFLNKGVDGVTYGELMKSSPYNGFKTGIRKLLLMSYKGRTQTPEIRKQFASLTNITKGARGEIEGVRTLKNLGYRNISPISKSGSFDKKATSPSGDRVLLEDKSTQSVNKYAILKKGATQYLSSLPRSGIKNNRTDSINLNAVQANKSLMFPDGLNLVSASDTRLLSNKITHKDYAKGGRSRKEFLRMAKNSFKGSDIDFSKVSTDNLRKFIDFAKKTYTEGYIPNFAKGLDTRLGFVSTQRLKRLQAGQSINLGKKSVKLEDFKIENKQGQLIDSPDSIAIKSFEAEYSKSKLIAAGEQRKQARNKMPTIDASRRATMLVASRNYRKKVDANYKHGDTNYRLRYRVEGLKPSKLKDTEKTLRTKVENLMLQESSMLAKNLSGAGGFGTNTPDAVKLANAGSVGSAAGTIFETAIQTVGKNKLFTKNNAGFDVVGMPDAKLQRLFGYYTPYADAKISFNPDTKRDFHGKLMKLDTSKKISSEDRRKQGRMAMRSRRKYGNPEKEGGASFGYIPNFGRFNLFEGVRTTKGGKDYIWQNELAQARNQLPEGTKFTPWAKNPKMIFVSGHKNKNQLSKDSISFKYSEDLREFGKFAANEGYPEVMAAIVKASGVKEHSKKLTGNMASQRVYDRMAGKKQVEIMPNKININDIKNMGVDDFKNFELGRIGAKLDNLYTIESFDRVKNQKFIQTPIGQREYMPLGGATEPKMANIYDSKENMYKNIQKVRGKESIDSGVIEDLYARFLKQKNLETFSKGFVPNFSKSPFKWGTLKHDSSAKQLTVKDTLSSLRYTKEPGRTTEIDFISSMRKGDASKLFETLLNKEKALKSTSLSPVRVWKENSKTNFEDLMWAFPQLQYRLKRGMETTGKVDLGKGQGFRFQGLRDLKERVNKNFGRDEFRKLIEGRPVQVGQGRIIQDRLSVKDLVTVYNKNRQGDNFYKNYSGGFMPNFGLVSGRNSKKHIEKERQIKALLASEKALGHNVKFKLKDKVIKTIKSKNMFQQMWLESYFKNGLVGDYQTLLKMGYDPDKLLALRKHVKNGGSVNVLSKGFIPNFARPGRKFRRFNKDKFLKDIRNKKDLSKKRDQEAFVFAADKSMKLQNLSEKIHLDKIDDVLQGFFSKGFIPNFASSYQPNISKALESMFDDYAVRSGAPSSQFGGLDSASLRKLERAQRQAQISEYLKPGKAITLQGDSFKYKTESMFGKPMGQGSSAQMALMAMYGSSQYKNIFDKALTNKKKKKITEANQKKLAELIKQEAAELNNLRVHGVRAGATEGPKMEYRGMRKSPVSVESPYREFRKTDIISQRRDQLRASRMRGGHQRNQLAPVSTTSMLDRSYEKIRYMEIEESKKRLAQLKYEAIILSGKSQAETVKMIRKIPSQVSGPGEKTIPLNKLIDMDKTIKDNRKGSIASQSRLDKIRYLNLLREETSFKPFGLRLYGEGSYSDMKREKEARQNLKDRIKSTPRRIGRFFIRGASEGYMPPLRDSYNREVKALRRRGLSERGIKLEQSNKLKNSKNPAGLAFTNIWDEPMGINQGIERSRMMGIDPKTHGRRNAAKGFIPNYRLGNVSKFFKPKKGNKKPLTDKEEAAQAAGRQQMLMALGFGGMMGSSIIAEQISAGDKYKTDFMSQLGIGVAYGAGYGAMGGGKGALLGTGLGAIYGGVQSFRNEGGKGALVDLAKQMQDQKTKLDEEVKNIEGLRAYAEGIKELNDAVASGDSGKMRELQKELQQGLSGITDKDLLSALNQTGDGASGLREKMEILDEAFEKSTARAESMKLALEASSATFANIEKTMPGFLRAMGSYFFDNQDDSMDSAAAKDLASKFGNVYAAANDVDINDTLRKQFRKYTSSFDPGGSREGETMMSFEQFSDKNRGQAEVDAYKKLDEELAKRQKNVDQFLKGFRSLRAAKENEEGSAEFDKFQRMSGAQRSFQGMSNNNLGYRGVTKGVNNRFYTSEGEIETGNNMSKNKKNIARFLLSDDSMAEEMAKGGNRKAFVSNIAKLTGLNIREVDNFGASEDKLSQRIDFGDRKYYLEKGDDGANIEFAAIEAYLEQYGKHRDVVKKRLSAAISSEDDIAKAESSVFDLDKELEKAVKRAQELTTNLDNFSKLFSQAQQDMSRYIENVSLDRSSKNQSLFSIGALSQEEFRNRRFAIQSASAMDQNRLQANASAMEILSKRFDPDSTYDLRKMQEKAGTVPETFKGGHVRKITQRIQDEEKPDRANFTNRFNEFMRMNADGNVTSAEISEFLKQMNVDSKVSQEILKEIAISNKGAEETLNRQLETLEIQRQAEERQQAVELISKNTSRMVGAEEKGVLRDLFMAGGSSRANGISKLGRGQIMSGDPSFSPQMDLARRSLAQMQLESRLGISLADQTGRDGIQNRKNIFEFNKKELRSIPGAGAEIESLISQVDDAFKLMENTRDQQDFLFQQNDLSYLRSLESGEQSVGIQLKYLPELSKIRSGIDSLVRKHKSTRGVVNDASGVGLTDIENNSEIKNFLARNSKAFEKKDVDMNRLLSTLIDIRAKSIQATGGDEVFSKFLARYDPAKDQEMGRRSGYTKPFKIVEDLNNVMFERLRRSDWGGSSQWDQAGESEHDWLVQTAGGLKGFDPGKDMMSSIITSFLENSPDPADITGQLIHSNNTNDYYSAISKATRELLKQGLDSTVSRDMAPKPYESSSSSPSIVSLPLADPFSPGDGATNLNDALQTSASVIESSTQSLSEENAALSQAMSVIPEQMRKELENVIFNHTVNGNVKIDFNTEELKQALGAELSERFSDILSSGTTALVVAKAVEGLISIRANQIIK